MGDGYLYFYRELEGSCYNLDTLGHDMRFQHILTYKGCSAELGGSCASSMDCDGPIRVSVRLDWVRYFQQAS